MKIWGLVKDGEIMEFVWGEDPDDALGRTNLDADQVVDTEWTEGVPNRGHCACENYKVESGQVKERTTPLHPVEAHVVEERLQAKSRRGQKDNRSDKAIEMEVLQGLKQRANRVGDGRDGLADLTKINSMLADRGA